MREKSQEQGRAKGRGKIHPIAVDFCLFEVRVGLLFNCQYICIWFHEFELKLVGFGTRLKIMLNAHFLDELCCNVVVMICSAVYLCLEPINIISKPFWVIGGLKMGFLDENGIGIVG